MSSAVAAVGLSARGTPPKIGMEIEANWPAYSSLPSDLRRGMTTTEYAEFQHIHGTRRCYSRLAPSSLPEKYHYPDGWDKGTDSGVEMRFDGPADSLERAENLIRAASQWLKDFGFTRFSGAGTHVHLGHEAWCDQMFGTDKQDLLRQRAEVMLVAYFATRENAIFKLSAPHRLNCGSCTPIFNSDSGATDALTGYKVLGKNTPLWAYRSFFMSRPHPTYFMAGLYSGSIQQYRKRIPTLEFRHFTGTHRLAALLGYVRLLYTMFVRATNVITEENLRAAKEDQLTDPIVVDPYTFRVEELKQEISDPWLLAWMDQTAANKGEPIETVDETKISADHIVRAPQPATA